MKYLINYGTCNNMKGGGSGFIERFCPLCGISFNMNLNEKFMIDLIKEDIEAINEKKNLSKSQKKNSIDKINLKIDRLKELGKIKNKIFAIKNGTPGMFR